MDKKENGFFEVLKKLDFLIVGILLCFIYFGFKPLFETVAGSSQVTIEALAAALGAILGAGFTWVLLNRQSEVENTNKQKDRFFQEKVRIFSDTIQNIEKSINEVFNLNLNDDKDNINEFKEKTEIFKLQVRSFRPKLILISDEKIQNSFNEVIQTIAKSSEDVAFKKKNFKKNFIEEVQTSIDRFAQICNQDMGMRGIKFESEKDYEEIEKEAQIKAGSEVNTLQLKLKKGEIKLDSKTRFDFKGKRNLAKRSLAYLLIKNIFEMEKSKIKNLEDFQDIIKKEWYSNPNRNVSKNAKIVASREFAESERQRTGYIRFYIGEDDIIYAGTDEVVITNQWGTNIKTFVDAMKDNYPELWQEIKISEHK